MINYVMFCMLSTGWASETPYLKKFVEIEVADAGVVQ